MAGIPVKEKKEVYSYRAKPSVRLKAQNTADRLKENLSEEIEKFLTAYSKKKKQTV